jgi:hypothetical protein
MAGLRLVLGVEVKAGNEYSGSHSLPGLLRVLKYTLAGIGPPKMLLLCVESSGNCGF